MSPLMLLHTPDMNSISGGRVVVLIPSFPESVFPQHRSTLVGTSSGDWRMSLQSDEDGFIWERIFRSPLVELEGVVARCSEAAVVIARTDCLLFFPSLFLPCEEICWGDGQVIVLQPWSSVCRDRLWSPVSCVCVQFPLPFLVPLGPSARNNSGPALIQIEFSTQYYYRPTVT